MAKGYPDFFGQSIFLKYGAFAKETGIVSVAGGDTETIVEVETKGILQGGYLYTADNDSLPTDNIYMYVDGVEIVHEAWSTLFAYQFGENVFSPLRLIYYDADDMMFCLLIKNNIPFESSVKLDYYNIGGGDVTVSGELYYQAIAQ